jgi:hypothetical protein
MSQVIVPDESGHRSRPARTERFHQTLQRWLRARPPARTLPELKRQLDEFRDHYNEQRPHRALARGTPSEAYKATPKAALAGPRAQQHYRLHRQSTRPQTRPGHRRRHPRHRHDLTTWRSPLPPPYPARQDLLAQPNQRARPMAELLTAET